MTLRASRTAAGSTTAGSARTNAPALGPDFFVELSLFAVTAASVVGLIRLFRSWSFLAPLLAVAAMAHLLAAVTRRRGWPIPAVLATGVVGLILTVSWTRYAGDTTAGLPTGATFHAMNVDLRHATDAFRTAVAPAPVLPGFLLFLAVLVWLVAYTSDWLAFRLSARAEAVVPAGGLFIFGAILGGRQHRILSAVLYGAAVLAFVLLHRTTAHRRSAHWVSGERRANGRSLLGTGLALGAVTALVGSAAALAVPGRYDTPALRWRNHGGASDGTRITVSPLVDIRDRLIDHSDQLLFQVNSPRAAYWRLTSLDRFNGRVWSANATFHGADGGQLAPGQHSRAAAGVPLDQTFQIYSLSQVWAPAAYEPMRVAPSEDLLYDKGSGTLIVSSQHHTSNNLQYEVDSLVPQPDPAELAGVRMRGIEPTFLHHYTELPDDLPRTVSVTARQVVSAARADTPYAEARALQDWFRENFTYSLHPGLSGESNDVITSFLRIRKGYCEQFAATYAAMARSLGLPTRVAVGFTPGIETPNQPGRYSVYGRQAHAWPEVYFPGQGWLSFDPTPGRGVPGAQAYTGVPFQQDARPPANGAAAPTTTAAGGGQGAAGSASTTTTPARARANRQHHHSSVPWPVTAVLAAGVLIVVLILAIGALPFALWLTRQRRRRRARSPDQRVGVAWDDACQALGWAGAPPEPVETRNEYATRAAERLPAAGQPLHQLADLAVEAAWAPGGTDPAKAGQAQILAGTVTTAVRDDLGPRRALLSRFDPRRAWEQLRRQRR